MTHDRGGTGAGEGRVQLAFGMSISPGLKTRS